MRVRVGDVKLYFDVDGPHLVPDGPAMRERPTIVVLHGGPGADHTLFKPIFTAATAFAQVIYLDQRGSGRSDRGDARSWTWERWADDVIAFCDVLEIADPVLLGTSSGGWVALTAALRHPDRLSKLVLDSVMPGPTAERLAVFERLGGPRAREVARRYWKGEGRPATKSAGNGRASAYPSTPAAQTATPKPPTGCAASAGTTMSSNTSGITWRPTSTPGTGSMR